VKIGQVKILATKHRPVETVWKIVDTVLDREGGYRGRLRHRADFRAGRRSRLAPDAQPRWVCA
jgi:hypothetical protein